MTLTEILLTITIQVLFCAGLRVLLSDGQILHFIREPFEYQPDSKINNYYRNKLKKKNLPTDIIYEIKSIYAEKSRIMSIILKPFLLCVVCFSSVWGGSVFIALHGFLPIPLVICCVSTAFILKFVNDKVEF